MPHVDIKYRTDLLTEDDLAGAVDQLIAVVAKHFQENPDFVSLEIKPQHAIVRNRKAVDIEIDSSPDPEGERARSAPVLARDLTEVLSSHLKGRGLHDLELSAWVRIFASGVYEYHRMQA
jgi:hypothetical protein